ALFSFSKLPIKLSLIIGILGIILSIGGASIVIYKKIIGDAITGWTSTMLAMFFFGSVQLFFLGIMGEYVYRIFVEAKERPIYIVRKLHENSEE
ncbi:MAG: glycosyltransferase, partial [Marinilabiliales bacterium]